MAEEEVPFLQEAINKLRNSKAIVPPPAGGALAAVDEAMDPNTGFLEGVSNVVRQGGWRLPGMRNSGGGDTGKPGGGIVNKARAGANPSRRAAPAANGQPAQPSVRRPQSQGTSVPDSTLDSRMPDQMPPEGSGIIRRHRTGRTQTINAREPSSENAQPRPSDNNQDLYQAPQVPNLALATDVDTLPAFLQQLSGAQQTNLRNRTGQANRRGIIASRRDRQNVEAADIENQQGRLELEQSQELDSVLDQLSGLDEASDPDGTRRRQLMDTALTLQGKQPSSDFQFKTVQATNPDNPYGPPVQQLVRINKGTGDYNIIGAAPGGEQAGGSPGGGAAGGAPGGGQASTPSYTQADLEFTAQQHGMTVDQVKQALGIQ